MPCPLFSPLTGPLACACASGSPPSRTRARIPSGPGGHWHAAPGTPRPAADGQRAPPAPGADRVPGALQHGPAAPLPRPAHTSSSRHLSTRAGQPRRASNPPEASPQRAHPRALHRRVTARRRHESCFRVPQGSDPASFQAKPPACHRASWQLPGPDFHRQATTSLRTRGNTMHHVTVPPPVRWAHEKAHCRMPCRHRTFGTARRVGIATFEGAGTRS
jgi:hypothetical protein